MHTQFGPVTVRNKRSNVVLGLGFFEKAFAIVKKNCIYVNITDDLTYCLSSVVQLKLSVVTPFMLCIFINILVIKIQILRISITNLFLYLSFS